VKTAVCGVCGVIQIGGDPRLPVNQSTLDRMTDAMIHRGPNDRGTHLAPGVALGVRRLSIVDVERGHQPLSDEDGRVWAVQNGELYNHAEIYRELERDGHRFRSRCDTEILPHLYERDGASFVERLRGKYGLAVWDADRRRAVIARDRLGVKPIYYATVDDLVIFASELKSLVASGLVDTALDVEGIDAYLTLGFFPAPRTPLAAVRKLMPGERLVVDPRGVRAERYWRYPQPEADPRSGVSVDEHGAELLDVLDESVRLRLMSDVPLGAMLSGGLDSSLIVALMARHVTGSVKTFSVGFVEAGSENELADAREIAALYGTEHHELELSFAQQEIELSDLVWYLDEPLADLSSLGFLALSQLAAKTVTVALSGQGADELLGGYSRHRTAGLATQALSLPRPIRRALGAASRAAPGRYRRAASVLEAADPVTRHLRAHAHVDAEGLRRLAAPSLARLEGATARNIVSERLGSTTGDPLATMLYLDGQLGLVDDMLHYFDRASMAHSLEVRVPFLDHVVVEHCARIPSRLKVRGTTTKYLLKRAARSLVPDRIIEKPKVGFFNAAVASWFEAQSSGAISDYLLGSRPRYEGVLERAEVERLVAGHATGAGWGESHLLLSILMLEVWLSEFLPRATAVSEPSAERITLSA
jgi:asparagine synthase (glutamine-hydrolysing)